MAHKLASNFTWSPCSLSTSVITKRDFGQHSKIEFVEFSTLVDTKSKYPTKSEKFSSRFSTVSPRRIQQTLCRSPLSIALVSHGLSWTVVAPPSLTTMNRNSERILKEHFEEDRPGFGSYLDCIARSYGTGLGVLALTFAVAHVSQQIASKRFPAVKRTHLAVSTLVGTTASYLAAKDKVRECRDSWARWQDRQQQQQQQRWWWQHRVRLFAEFSVGTETRISA